MLTKLMKRNIEPNIKPPAISFFQMTIKNSLSVIAFLQKAKYKTTITVSAITEAIAAPTD